MCKAIAIIGPTAVGKTELSLEIASALNAEIISVDSRQVYRYMDVGTDKISAEIRRRTLHHLIDVADPDEDFTVARFVEMSRSCVARMTSRGRVPLFVGGTPFYFQALFSPMLNSGVPHDKEVRARYEAMALSEGREALHARLSAIDPVTAARLHMNDVRRVSRALEIYELTGKPPSALFADSEKMRSPYEVLYIGLNRDRSELFSRIEERVAWQFHHGYPEEVEWLLKNGYDESLPSMQGFGYRELVEYVKGRMSFDEALQGDISSTKAFCRRQMTWFTKFSPVVWYDAIGGSFASLKSAIIERCVAYMG